MKIELSQIIAQIISFLIMLFVMKKFAWKPLLAVLDERKKRIEDEFDAMENKKTEMAKAEEAFQEKIRGIEEIALMKNKEAIEKGKQVAHEIYEKAYSQAKALLEKNQTDLQREISQAKIQLKNEMVKITMEATDKLVKSTLSKEEQEGLIHEFIEQVGKS